MSLALSGVDKTSTGPSYEEVWERIAPALKIKTQAELADLINIRPPSVTDAKTRGVFPLGWAYSLSIRTGLSLDYIVKGTPAPAQEASAQASPPPCAPELVMVPKVRARLSAGTGSLENGGEIEGLYAFRREFLARKGVAARMVLMEISGDSMEPELKEGDTVLVDLSQTDVLSGRIYAVGIGEEVMVKQVDRAPGKYVLRSKNAAYESIPIELSDESVDFRVIGRVLWWCREAR